MSERPAGWLSDRELQEVEPADKAAAPQAYDLVLANGRILDGCGNPWFRGDLGEESE